MKRIELSHEIPPIYEELKSRFNVDWDKGLIIAYDGRIHCKEDPYPAKIVHENVHLEEQNKIGNEVWWKCYLESAEFRLNEEKKAYFAEAQFLKKYIKNREDRFKMIWDMASIFSSLQYGGIISRKDAMELLL